MAGFDRSKLKATTATALQSKQREQETKRPTAGGGAGYLEIKPGTNKFRIFPFHPDSGIDTYAVPVTVSYLMVTKPKRDEKTGRVIEGEFENKRSRVFNGKVHGNLPKDLVEEYMTFAKKVAIPNFVEGRSNAKELGDKIWNIMTYAGKGSQAIKPSDAWTVYAMKEEGKDGEGGSIWSKPGLLDLKRTITAQFTEKAIEFSGDALTPDIYTDPDTGICVIITKKGEGKDTEYKMELDTAKYKEGTRMVSAAVETPLTDDQIEAWFKLPSLAKMFVNSFKRKDFEYQIEGLQNFDNYLTSQGYPINVFGYDEFQQVIGELMELVPEGGSEEEEAEVGGDEAESGSAAVDTAGVEVGGAEDDGSEEEITEDAPAPVVAPKVSPKPAPAKPAAAPVAKPSAPAKPVAPVSKPAAPAVKTPVAPAPAKPAAPVVAKPAAPAAPVVSSEDRIARVKAMMNKKNPA